MITAISIKMYFKLKKNIHGKPKFKNTIIFRRLNNIYSVGLICAAVLQSLFLSNDWDMYILHYNVATVLNLMLLSFVFGDKDARHYFMLKFNVWKEANLFRLLQVNMIKTKCKIGPTFQAELPVKKEINQSRDETYNQVFVIDLENE